jgi:malate synthase
MRKRKSFINCQTVTDTKLSNRVNDTMSQVNANLNAAVSTTLVDFEAAEAKSEVSSAVGMTNAKGKGKGKAKAIEEEVGTSASVPVGDEAEAEEAV